jgi:hypothetical protein
VNATAICARANHPKGYDMIYGQHSVDRQPKPEPGPVPMSTTKAAAS